MSEYDRRGNGKEKRAGGWRSYRSMKLLSMFNQKIGFRFTIKSKRSYK